MVRRIVTKNLIFILFWALFLSGVFGFSENPVFASSTDGTIDSSDKYAWGENIGWLNFGTTEGNVHITDSNLTGYAWGENLGWISLNCSNDSSCATVDYKVANDGEGTLSGYAWSENTGWINFNPTYGGVTINSSGEFLGYAWGENIGWIVFNCLTTNSCGTVDYKVKTDWRSQSARPACNNSSDDDGDGKTDYPNDPGCDSLTDTDETDPVVASATGGRSNKSQFINNTYTTPTPTPTPASDPEPTFSLTDITEGIISISNAIKNLATRSPEQVPEVIVLEETISDETPLALSGVWNLLGLDAIKRFALAPLPRDIRTLAKQFPEFAQTLKEVGVERLTDLNKLKGVTFVLPGLSSQSWFREAGIAVAEMTLPQGVPLSDLSPEVKVKIPTEFVFVRGPNELIDLDVLVVVNEAGSVNQKISVTSGQSLTLLVKPDGIVSGVTGFLVFKSNTPDVGTEISRNNLALVLSAVPTFTEETTKAVPTEERLVLKQFNYTDPDGDGIYMANVDVPVVTGVYEIITVIGYQDPDLGLRQIRLTTVIDPEGYVYEESEGKQTRIPQAQVSLFWLNPLTDSYELWPAKNYQQINPQETDVTGTYSFLVSEGEYYLSVEASGYKSYRGEKFRVSSGSGVHENIELEKSGILGVLFDWKLLFLIFVVLLLIYNFYRDHMREAMLKLTKRT